MKSDKKAVSPIVSTIFLILIVFILAVIIIIWTSGFFKEAITKEIAGKKKTVEQFCSEVGLRPILNENDGSFGVENIGNVPIYALNLKLSSGGSSQVKKLSGEDGLVNTGFNKMINGYSYHDYDEVKIIPIVLGKTKSGAVNEFECPESDALIIK